MLYLLFYLKFIINYLLQYPSNLKINSFIFPSQKKDFIFLEEEYFNQFLKDILVFNYLILFVYSRPSLLFFFYLI